MLVAFCSSQLLSRDLERWLEIQSKYTDTEARKPATRILWEESIEHNGKKFSLVYADINVRKDTDSEYMVYTQGYVLYLIPREADYRIDNLYEKSVWASRLTDVGYVREEDAWVGYLDEFFGSSDKAKYEKRHQVLTIQLHGPSNDPEWMLFGFDSQGRFQARVLFVGYVRVLERLSEEEYVIAGDKTEYHDNRSGSLLYCDKLYVISMANGNVGEYSGEDTCVACRGVGRLLSGVEMKIYQSIKDTIDNSSDYSVVSSAGRRVDVGKRCRENGKIFYWITVETGAYGWISEESAKYNVVMHTTD